MSMIKLTRDEILEVWENLQYTDVVTRILTFADAIQVAVELKNNPVPEPKLGCWVEGCEGEECVLNENNSQGYLPMDCQIAADNEYTQQEQCVYWYKK